MESSLEEKFDSYPPGARSQLLKIRSLIFEVAAEEGVGEITETLKWGEPSYSSKQGSPIRIAWKAKRPDRVCIYFNCKTVLVETFRELHADTFEFSGNREITFSLTNAMPVTALKQCISQALRYKRIRHLPLLGA